VKYDGVHWWITVSIEEPIIEQELSDETIGVDVGIKKLLVASNGLVVKNINKTAKVKKLLRKKKKVQR